MRRQNLGKLRAINENLELYFLVRASYCALFSQYRYIDTGQNKPLVSRSDKTRIFTSQIVNRGILRYQKSGVYATKSQVLLAAYPNRQDLKPAPNIRRRINIPVTAVT